MCYDYACSCIDPFLFLTTEVERMDCLTKNVMDALKNMKHSYLGVWSRDKFRTLDEEQKRHFKRCMKEITNYLEEMNEWVDEIETELKETTEMKQKEIKVER